MKKILVFAVLILAIVLAFFIPFNQQKTFNIKVQYFIALQQLLQPEKWKNWQPDVKKAFQENSAQVKFTNNKSKKTFAYSAPGLLLFVNNKQGFAFNILKDIYGKINTYTYIVIPKTIDNTTNIIVVTRTSIITLIYKFFNNYKSTQSDIVSFKNYIENAQAFYGFDIRKTTVTDSNVVVIKKMVLAKNKMLEVAKIRADLNAFIKKNQLKEVQPVIADIRTVGQDSLRMMIGLPINKKTVSAQNVIYMSLPTHGRMLVGYYTGKYAGREKLYLAMKSYMSDHSLSAPEDPYEKYLDDKIPANDSSFVHLQVNFPIF